MKRSGSHIGYRHKLQHHTFLHGRILILVSTLEPLHALQLYVTTSTRSISLTTHCSNPIHIQQFSICWQSPRSGSLDDSCTQTKLPTHTFCMNSAAPIPHAPLHAVPQSHFPQTSILQWLARRKSAGLGSGILQWCPGPTRLDIVLWARPTIAHAQPQYELMCMQSSLLKSIWSFDLKFSEVIHEALSLASC